MRQSSRLEKLYYIFRWIKAKNLFASRTFYDIVFELHAVLFQSGDFRFKVVNGNYDSIPSSRCRFGPVRHRPSIELRTCRNTHESRVLCVEASYPPEVTIPITVSLPLGQKGE